MAKIFRAPKGMEPPKIDYAKEGTFDKWMKVEQEYLGRLGQAIKKAYGHRCKEAGKVITFPVADGNAIYIVCDLKPVQLVWVELGDAYQFQYAHRLLASDIREAVRRMEGLAKLFGGAKKAAPSLA
jgi:hypothetical protein